MACQVRVKFNRFLLSDESKLQGYRVHSGGSSFLLSDLSPKAELKPDGQCKVRNTSFCNKDLRL